MMSDRRLRADALPPGGPGPLRVRHRPRLRGAGRPSVVAGLRAEVMGRFGARRTLVGSLSARGPDRRAAGAGAGSRSSCSRRPRSPWRACATWARSSRTALTVTSGVPDEEQGLATGLVTSTQQVGITVGIPLLGVLATTSGGRSPAYRRSPPWPRRSCWRRRSGRAGLRRTGTVEVRLRGGRGGAGRRSGRPATTRSYESSTSSRTGQVREFAVDGDGVPVALVHVVAGGDQPGCVGAQPDRVLRVALEVDLQGPRVQSSSGRTSCPAP